jgi:hypothetical protein
MSATARQRLAAMAEAERDAWRERAVDYAALGEESDRDACFAEAATFDRIAREWKEEGEKSA